MGVCFAAETRPDSTPLHSTLLQKNKMGKFDGTFKLECQSNLAAAFKAMGVPDADTKRYLDPKNCVVYTIAELADGAYETKSTISELPEWNQTSCFKLGERTELKTPFEHAVTMTKKDENTFCMKTEMGGKVIFMIRWKECTDSGRRACLFFTPPFG